MLYSLFEYPFSVDFFTSNTEREREQQRDKFTHTYHYQRTYKIGSLFSIYIIEKD